MNSRPAPMVVLKAAAAAAVAVLVFYERGLIVSSFEAATRVRWVWLVLAVVLEALSIASFAAIQARLLRAGPRRVGFMAVMKTVYAGGALSATVPVVGSQVSFAFVFRRFKRLGVDSAVAAWVLVVAGVISSSASALLLVAGAILSGNEVAAAAGSASGLIGAAGFVLAVIAVRRRGVLIVLVRPAGWVLRRISAVVGRPVDDPDTVLRAAAGRVASLHLPFSGWAIVCAAALLNWLADIAVLAASLSSLGAPVPWRGLLLAYGIGTAAGSVGLIPGGLGVEEAALALTLMGAGVHHPVALAAVLVYRLISFWMVTSIGWLAYLKSPRDARDLRSGMAWAGRRGRSERAGDEDLDLPVSIADLQSRQGSGPGGELREQHVA